MDFVDYFNLNISAALAERMLVTVLAILLLFVARLVAFKLLKNHVDDDQRRYRYRRTAHNVYLVLMLIMVGSIWFKGMASLGTIVGLAGAGLAVALHDIIANVAGFFFIESRKPFRVGDRIQSGEICGDVIDIRLFQFSVEEVGNWIDADQSTGRIVHIPNWRVLSEPLANYHIGFAYIWNEVVVAITLDSEWALAKKKLLEIAQEHGERFSADAAEQVQSAAEEYHLIYEGLAPTVKTSVKDGAIMLSIRYVVDPRKRRQSEERIWEAILKSFLQCDTLKFAAVSPPAANAPAPLSSSLHALPKNIDDMIG